MTMLYIGICDDEESALAGLQKRVEAYLAQCGEMADIRTYGQSRMLLYDIQEGLHLDLILSDIEMPQIDGMELAREIRKVLPEVLIIFITAYERYAVDAYELSIFRYIPKSMLEEKLEKALGDAFAKLLAAEETYRLETARQVQVISQKKIVYVQKDGKNIQIVLEDGAVFHERKSLKRFAEEIRSEGFVYADRSCLVSLEHIVQVKSGVVTMSNGVSFCVGMARAAEIRRTFNRFWGDKMIRRATAWKGGRP